MAGKTATYDRLWRDLFVTLMGGQRIYYPEPQYFIQEQLGRRCATIFKIKQAIPNGLFNDLLIEEYPDKKKRPHGIQTDLYANRLKLEVAEKTWNNAKRPLSQRITYEWGITPFEEWLEETCEWHWMTAEWFQTQENGHDPFGDYAFMISVHTPLLMPQAEFDEAYGEAFVMTKLMHG